MIPGTPLNQRQIAVLTAAAKLALWCGVIVVATALVDLVYGGTGMHFMTIFGFLLMLVAFRRFWRGLQ